MHGRLNEMPASQQKRGIAAMRGAFLFKCMQIKSARASSDAESE